ncbi:hypothetical protein PPROV_000003800 [Pycnococcus provasolii]|uniref:Uncharacterized protein n=1 Tax=Pycnococcus provasolii TaxID=41880 RepID=A0A830H438_9CHLO|nr:hypothetical protein PPROV_000003800 [Pycnococcus provasolii]
MLAPGDALFFRAHEHWHGVSKIRPFDQACHRGALRGRMAAVPPSTSQLGSFLEDARRNVGGSVNISSITCDGVGITAKVMVKNDATFDATKGDLYAKLLESAEKHEVELSFEKRIVLQPPASE